MASKDEITPPQVRRKIRRSPVRDRERCLDAVVRGGLFVLPMDARRAGPVVYWLNKMSIVVYNRVGDMMIVKADLQAAMIGAEGAELIALKSALSFINREMNLLRKQGFKLRKYVLDVEKAQAINEPLNWARG